jgi:hypothetical protein
MLWSDIQAAVKLGIKLGADQIAPKILLIMSNHICVITNIVLNARN